MRTLEADAPTSQHEATVFDHEPWMGEPPTDFHKSADDWLEEIENQLQAVEVLKLLDEEWLEPTGISERLEPLIKAFCARGGRVERSRA
jgi:hypothetical protein